MDLHKVKENLSKLLADVQASINRLTNMDPSKDSSRGQTNTMEEDVNEAESGFRIGELLDQAKTDEQKISDAIKRVDDGSYGICQRCGKQISEERLAARPDARFCIDCQKIMDAAIENN